MSESDYEESDFNYQEDQLPEVYGWFESGGATENTSLSYIDPIDVVLRTDHKNSKIVIGNSDTENENTNAAVYIDNNRIGINSIPQSYSDESFYVNGNIGIRGTQSYFPNNFVNNIHYGLQLNSSNIDFLSSYNDDNINSSNSNLLLPPHSFYYPNVRMQINSKGEIKNKTIISESINIDSNKRFDVKLLKFAPNFQDGDTFTEKINKGYTIITDLIWRKYFNKGIVFSMDQIKYIVLEIKLINSNEEIPNIIILIKHLYPEEFFKGISYPDTQTIKTIDFYDNVILESSKELKNILQNELVRTLVTITDYKLSNNGKEIQLKVSLPTQNDIFNLQNQSSTQRDELFIKGYYYYFHNFIIERTPDKDLDNALLCKKADPIILPGNIKEYNLIFTGIDNESIEHYFVNIMDTIDNGKNDLVFFYPLNIPIFLGDVIPKPIKIEILSEDNIVTSKKVRYEIQADKFVINYLLNENFNQNYINDSLFINEPSKETSGLWKIKNFDLKDLNTGFLELDAFYLDLSGDIIGNINSKRVVEIFFLNVKNVNRLGNKNDNIFVPENTNMGLGTSLCPEKLTVNGSASCREHFLMYNFNSSKPIHFRYSNDLLRVYLNNGVESNISVEFENNPNDFDNLRFIDFMVSPTSVKSKDNEAADILINARTQMTQDTFFSYQNEENRNIPLQYFKINGNKIASFIESSENTSIDTYGTTQTKMLHTHDLTTPVYTLENVKLKDVIYNRTFFDKEHKKIKGIIIQINISYKSRLLPNDFIRIDDVLFKIIKTNIPEENPDFRYMYVYLEWTLPQQEDYVKKWSKGDLKDIIIYKDLDIKNNRVTCLDLKVNKIEFKKDIFDKHIYLNLSGTLKEEDIEFLVLGRFYMIKSSKPRPGSFINRNVENIVILKAITHISRESFILEFKSVDNITDLKKDTSLGIELDFEKMRDIDPNVFIFPLNSFFQPNKRQFPYEKYKLSKFPYEKIVENNVNLSYSAETNDRMFINLENTSELSKWIINTNFLISPIDKIYTERGVYEIVGLHRKNQFVRAQVKFMNTNYMKAINDTTISYAISGIPAHVIDTEFPRDDISMVLYVKDMDQATFDLLRLYVGDSLFLMDKYNIIWTLNNIFQTHKKGENLVIMTLVNLNQDARVFDNEDRVNLSVERFVFFIPIQLFIHQDLSKETNKTDITTYSKIGIGTEYIKEMLTVEGSMSCKNDFVVYDNNSEKPFTFSYDKDTFKLDENIGISKSNILMQSDLEIDGVITSKGYLTNSDERLKSNIEITDIYADLEFLSKINIHTFDFIDQNDNDRISSFKQKGVLAQEVEKVFPNIVSDKYGIIPNIQRKAKIVMKNDVKMFYFKKQDIFHKNKISDDVFQEGKKWSIYKINDQKKKYIIQIENGVICENNDIFVPFSFDNIKDNTNIELFETFFIHGVYDLLKIVDYTYLQMTNINAMKALSDKINKLEKKISSLSSTSLSPSIISHDESSESE